MVPGQLILINGTGYGAGLRPVVTFMSTFNGPDNSPVIRRGEVLGGSVIQGEGFLSAIVRVPNFPIPGSYAILVEASNRFGGKVVQVSTL